MAVVCIRLAMRKQYSAQEEDPYRAVKVHAANLERLPPDPDDANQRRPAEVSKKASYHAVLLTAERLPAPSFYCSHIVISEIDLWQNTAPHQK
jgi:hypothetical protein